MEDIINETLSEEAIQEFARTHAESKASGGQAELTARFQYACALLRSQHQDDIKKGITLLEELYSEGEQSARRDYLYYIAIGQTRLKRYSLALDIIEHFLQSEPENHQARRLRSYIKEKLTKDGLVGMAITGGAALLVGGLIGLALSKK